MARVRFLQRVIFLGLAALASFSATRAEGQETVTVITWGIGIEAADATKNLARWNADQAVLSGVLHLAPGYPKILTHAELPELDPKAHSVVLGICEPDQANLVVGLLDAFSPFTRIKQIKRPSLELACPQPVGGWTYQRSLPMEIGSNSVWSSLFGKRESASGLPLSLVHLYLRNTQDELLDFKEIAFPAGCTATLSTDVGVIRIEKTCTGPGAPPKELLRIAAVNGKIGPAPELGQLAEVQAVLWESAATPAASQEALERWQREKAAVEGILELPAGYPKVVASDGYPGLAPGSQVVLLGVCPAARLTEPMKVLKAFRPQVLAKKVKLSSGEPDCPKLIANLAVSHVEQLDAKPYRLTAVLHGRSNYLWDLRLYLRDAQGTLLDWRREDGRTLGILGRPSGECTDAMLQPDFSSPSSGSGRIAVDAQCRTTDEVSSRGFEVRSRYWIRQGKIAVQTEVGKPH